MPYKNKQSKTCIGCGVEYLTFYPSQRKYCTQICARQFQVIPPHSEEHKQKIRESNQRTWSRPEIKSKVQGENSPLWGKTMKHRGKNHHNWKGGVSSKNKLLRSRFLQTIQPKVLKRDNYTCQFCKQYGGYLQIDHIKSWANYSELRFDLDNCRTLCMACHYYVTFKRKLPKGVVWGHNLSKRVAS